MKTLTYDTRPRFRTGTTGVNSERPTMVPTSMTRPAATTTPQGAEPGRALPLRRRDGVRRRPTALFPAPLQVHDALLFGLCPRRLRVFKAHVRGTQVRNGRESHRDDRADPCTGLLSRPEGHVSRVASRLRRSTHVRRIVNALAGRQVTAYRQHPHRLRHIVEQYEVGALIECNGRVPVRWWADADNFGDLLSPWLISKMTGREIVFANPNQPHYAAIGSILNRLTWQSEVWGSGSFGNEDTAEFQPEANYHAVRGPLSRARILKLGAKCPPVYGDPALLAPAYSRRRSRRRTTTGSSSAGLRPAARKSDIGPGVRLIDLGTSDVEGVIESILSCRRIVTGSLHGLIMADAYGIPSAYVKSLLSSRRRVQVLRLLLDGEQVPQSTSLRHLSPRDAGSAAGLLALRSAADRF